MIYDKNVYILGAGFSRDAGAPLMADFMLSMKNLWENPNSLLDASERERFAHILKYRADLNSVRSKINIDLGNIEELLGLAEMDVDWGNKEIALKNDYIYSLLRTIEITTKNYNLNRNVDLSSAGFTASPAWLSQIVPQKGGNITSIYHLFAVLLKQSRIVNKFNIDSIITFNYDVLLEKALLEVNITIDYAVHSIPTMTIVKKPILESGYYKPESKIYYLKLHGSANWVFCSHCNFFHIVPPHPKEFKENFELDPGGVDSLLQNIIHVRCPNCKKIEKMYPVIVPPTWNKFQYQQLISTVWQKALHEIRTAHRIIIIGYSLPATDTFFKYLLALGCHTEFDPEIIIINPDEEGTKQKYEAFFDQYYRISNFKFYKRKFDKKIFSIAGPVMGVKEPSIQEIVYRFLPR